MFKIINNYPANGSKNIDLDTTIEFKIVSDSAGINISTLNVSINDELAILDGDFTSRFDDALSEITPDGDDYSVIIDPDFLFNKDKQIVIKIQVKNLNNEFFNSTFFFKTVTEKPVLIKTSPEDSAIVKSPQVIYLEFQDRIDGIDLNSINVNINDLEYVTDGVLNSDITLSSSEIILDSTSAFIKIEFYVGFRNGKYKVNYSVADVNQNILNGFFNYTIDLVEIILPDVIPQTGFLGFYQGIKRVTDNGIGDSLYIEWNKPLKRFSTTDVFLLVFENNKRLNVFDGLPKYIARDVIDGSNVRGLTTSKTLSYGVRALETYPNVFDLSGMDEESDDFFKIPSEILLTSNFDVDDQILSVSSTSGYPSRGLLIINSEVVGYNAKTSTSFIVPPTGRGLNKTIPSVHISGDECSMFLKCGDDNTVIIMATPTYQDGYESGRELEGVGVLVTDYSDSDKNFFEGFDFCGYHNQLPQELIGGVNDCGTYQGGEFNKFRGLNLYDRLLDREEVLLNVTGEPVMLLKRNWSGTTCSCMNSRKAHPKISTCPNCYGTGWDPGYNQYANLRRIDRNIMVKINESPEDLKLGEYERFQQEFEPSGWTLPIPAVRDRDMLVRFDQTGDIEYIYEILDVSREKIFLNKYGRQTFRLKRMDKTDIIYTYPFIKI